MLTRRRLTWAVSASALVFAVLSLGPELKVDRKETGIPLPYALLQHVPLFDSALPSRLALSTTTRIYFIHKTTTLSRGARLRYELQHVALIGVRIGGRLPASRALAGRPLVLEVLSPGRVTEHARWLDLCAVGCA